MYTTREYTRLIGNGCDDVTINPNTEFKAFEGDYTVTCYALIKDTESDEVIILKPGDKVKGVGKIESGKFYNEQVKEAFEKSIEKLEKAVVKRKPRKRKVKKDGI